MNRKNPMSFETLQEAKNYAVSHYTAVWARLGTLAGVFHVYPGGRVVRYHLLTERCWCEPTRDQREHRVLLHNEVQ